MIFRLEGERDLLRALDNVSDAGSRTARVQIVGAALNVQTGARRHLTTKVYSQPIGPSGYKRTGRLRNSIAVADSERENARASSQATGEREAPKAITGKTLNAVIGTNVVYGPRIEFGFSDTDSLGRTYDQPAKPYLHPAFEEERADFPSRLRNALRKEITKAAR